MVSLKDWLNNTNHTKFLSKHFLRRKIEPHWSEQKKLDPFDTSDMTRKSDTRVGVDFEDRRVQGERRMMADRRNASERRQDTRDGDARTRKSLRGWFRSMTNARLGVDRRKGERRSGFDRRQKNLYSLLTKNEIEDLLSS